MLWRSGELHLLAPWRSCSVRSAYVTATPLGKLMVCVAGYFPLILIKPTVFILQTMTLVIELKSDLGPRDDDADLNG